MNCAVHADVLATGFCRECGQALCPACARPVRDMFYCEECLAKITGQAASQAPAAAPTSSPHPGLAFLLGFCIPGLGAVYNGEYNKALIHIAIFATLVVGQVHVESAGAHVMLGLMIAGFVFYMGIDAMRTAQATLSGHPSPEPLAVWSKERPIGAMILIVLGGLFLLGNFGWFDWDLIGRGWPLILIVAGILLLQRRLGRSS